MAEAAEHASTRGLGARGNCDASPRSRLVPANKQHRLLASQQHGALESAVSVEQPAQCDSAYVVLDKGKHQFREKLVVAWKRLSEERWWHGSELRARRGQATAWEHYWWLKEAVSTPAGSCGAQPVLGHTGSCAGGQAGLSGPAWVGDPGS